MEKGPFSLYDFMGYFIPGALALYLIFIGVDGDFTDFSSKFFLKNEEKFIEIPLYMIVFYVIIAYCFGHFLSFLSTLTVERYTRLFYGYPSNNLLAIVEQERKKIIFQNLTFNKIIENLMGNLSLIIILPLIIFDSIMYFLQYKHKYMEQIPLPYRELVKNKINKAFQKIGYSVDVFSNTDNNYHQLLIHYNYEYTQAHSSKLMNYVSLYGFLRVITLISSVYLTYLIYYFFTNYSIEWGWKYIKDTIVIFSRLIFYGFITFIFYLSYLKFYRRYTLENLMLILIVKKP